MLCVTDGSECAFAEFDRGDLTSIAFGERLPRWPVDAGSIEARIEIATQCFALCASIGQNRGVFGQRRPAARPGDYPAPQN
jgi:hypothetical protein